MSDFADHPKAPRKLAAILAADIAGYSELMGIDEEATVRDLKGHQAVILPLVGTYNGRIIDTAGDGILAEFASIVHAVECAVTIQKTMAERNADLDPARRMQFRIGINLGDVIHDDARVYGDGVNIAARLESIAEPGGICVSGDAYGQVQGKLPLRFVDLGEQQLKNIRQSVRVYRIEAEQFASASASSAVADKPSIAVLPFDNLGADPEHEYLADGITEDIITGLAKLRWVMVIARNSTFVYKGRSVDVRQVARDLGVRYVLEGSVRASSGRVRITGQLIDAATGKHIWAEKYDRELADIFAVQDDITVRVVAAVEPHLYAEEGLRFASRPPDSIGAWGLVVRAMGLINRVERRQSEEARKLLAHAIVLEPGYARAHALLGWAVWWAALCYWLPDRVAGNVQAAAHARDALARDPSDPWARMVAGLCHSSAGRHEQALVELETALNLNPSFALGRMVHGWVLLRAGRFDEAIAETSMALRLSPVDTFSGFYVAIHGLALLGARRFAEALPHLRAAVEAFAEYSGHYNTLISCCGHLGLTTEAQEFISRRNQVGPPLRIGVLRVNLGKFAHVDVFIEGLRKAGVPE